MAIIHFWRGTFELARGVPVQKGRVLAQDDLADAMKNATVLFPSPQIVQIMMISSPSENGNESRGRPQDQD